MVGGPFDDAPSTQSANPATVRVRKSDFSIIRRNCPVQLVLAGEFDIGSVRDLTAAVSEAASSADVLRVDLADVSFCDLAALRAIVSPAQAGGYPVRPVVLHHPSAEVERLLLLTGWDSLAGLTVDHQASSERT